MMGIANTVDALLNKLLALRTQRGPYKFLTRKWDKITDIDLAIQVFGSEYFRRELTPMSLSLENVESILVLAPHQDDETIGAGGTLLMAAEAGTKIDILFMSDGAQQAKLEDSIELSANIRYQEAKEVCSRICADMHQLNISNQCLDIQKEDLKHLADLIKRLKPQVVMVPWLLDFPPKHRLMNHLLYLSHRGFGLPVFEIWAYQVHNTLYPNGYVDITKVAEEKRRLLEIYRSQNEYYKRYDHLAMGMCAWNSRFFLQESAPPIARYLEVFFRIPSHEYFNLIESFYFSDFDTTYRGHKEVIKGITAIHQTIVGNGR